MRWVLPLLLAAGAAEAEPRPVQRPAPEVEMMSAVPAPLPAEPAVPASPRPVGRLTDAVRDRRAEMQALRRPWSLIDTEGLVRLSGRPALRDPALIPAASARPRDRATGGGLCGRGSIRGESIPPVPGAGQCGIPNAVRILTVSGVQLSRPARMDCETARALDDWVRAGVLPVMRDRGGGAVALRVAAGYSCRARNNRPGARLSEHSFGRAIDISGIFLANGEEITLLRGWNSSDGQRLRALWRAACGPFGTVLGPESDRFHRDHFHFDTARYRSGSYCR